MDISRMISEVAARNGIRIDKEDPAFCLVTLNEIVLEETVSKIIESVRQATADFESAVEKTQGRAGRMIAQETQELMEASRQFAMDESAKGGLAAKAHRTRWIAAGLCSSLFIFAAGVLTGMALR